MAPKIQSTPGITMDPSTIIQQSRDSRHTSIHPVERPSLVAVLVCQPECQRLPESIIARQKRPMSPSAHYHI